MKNYTGVDPKHDWAGIASALCNLEHPCHLMVGSIWMVACWAGRAEGEAAKLEATVTSRAGMQLGATAGSKAGSNGNFEVGHAFRNSFCT